MTDDRDVQRQWTDRARDTYAAQGEELIKALRKHIELTLARSDRHEAQAEYTQSAERLRRAAAGLDQAEFDWCGSFPLGLGALEWDDLESDDQNAVDMDVDILTVVGRWDYQVVDGAALMSAGRASYAALWPESTNEDAASAVEDLAAAVREIAHRSGWGALDAVAGLQSAAFTTSVILHHDEDTSWLDDDADPFAIARLD